MDDAHGVSRSSRPTGGSSTTRPPSMSTSGTMAVTNGTSASRPSVNRRTNRSWAVPGCRADHLADLFAGNGHGFEPHEIPFIPRVLVAIVVQRIGEQLDASKRLGPAAIVGALETEQQDAVVVTGAAQHHRAGFAAGSVTKLAPGTKRSSAAPVRTCTVTSPRSPCAFPIRATTTCTGPLLPKVMWR